MGAYYFYVNETKHQYFCIDPSGLEIKNVFIGRNIGSRALSYLLLDNNEDFTGVTSHPLVGSWIGDRFFITGDDYRENFSEIQVQYKDIGQEIVELMVTVEPWDLLTYGGYEWLINLIQWKDCPIKVTPSMRKRLSHEFRDEYRQDPNDALAKVIESLRQ